MGRRKKEEPQVHRDCISDAAEQLFMRNGIEATTMDDIAKHANYSKATLYVYFKNKEELVATLVLKSMKILQDCLHKAVYDEVNTMDRYDRICRELVNYYDQYPFYYEIVIGEINIDFENSKVPTLEKETFALGEQVMADLAHFVVEGQRAGIFLEQVQVAYSLFFFWASLSGIILMAEKKEKYIEMMMGLSKQEFLEQSFAALLKSILK